MFVLEKHYPDPDGYWTVLTCGIVDTLDEMNDLLSNLRLSDLQDVIILMEADQPYTLLYNNEKYRVSYIIDTDYNKLLIKPCPFELETTSRYYWDNYQNNDPQLMTTYGEFYRVRYVSRGIIRYPENCASIEVTV